MKIAILLVLVLIAVLIAPWLLGVIAAAAVAYGVWVFIVAAGVAVAIVLASIWKYMTGQTEAGKRRRIARLAAQSNKRYREKGKQQS